MSNKQLEKRKSGTLTNSVPYQQGEVIHVQATPIEKRVRFTIPILTLTIATILFLLAFAGPAIGNVLGYLVIPLLGAFPGMATAERYGKVAGVLAGLLVVAVLTPAYGTTLIANSISLFTSLQQISQTILVLVGIVCSLLGLALLVLGRRK